MTHILHTFVTTLLSSTPDVRLDKVTVERDTVWLDLTATAPQARCPWCAVSASFIHSRYQRHLTDLPWGMRIVRLQLTVRKFTNLLRTSKFCAHAYRAAVWHSRHNYLSASGDIGRPSCFR